MRFHPVTNELVPRREHQHAALDTVELYAGKPLVERCRGPSTSQLHGLIPDEDSLCGTWHRRGSGQRGIENHERNHPQVIHSNVDNVPLNVDGEGLKRRSKRPLAARTAGHRGSTTNHLISHGGSFAHLRSTEERELAPLRTKLQCPFSMVFDPPPKQRGGAGVSRKRHGFARLELSSDRVTPHRQRTFSSRRARRLPLERQLPWFSGSRVNRPKRVDRMRFSWPVHSAGGSSR